MQSTLHLASTAMSTITEASLDKNLSTNIFTKHITVEPLYNEHIGAERFVRYKEVSFIERFVQKHVCNSVCNSHKVLL